MHRPLTRPRPDTAPIIAAVNPVLKFLRQLTTLQLALGVSVAVHAALLTVRFVDPERFNRVFQDTPLEVILVNAKSDEKPEKARAIAQASLAGGGDAEKGRATSPLPPMAQARLGDTPEEDERMIEALKERQDQILAEIEKRINEENARPKKRYISPATREEVYAIYYDELRRKIEDRGTTNFPEAAGRKLYGELTMVITVNHTGAVIDTEIVQTSGNTTLDRRAQSIVRSLGFGRFNDNMRRRADQIVVVSRFRFTRDATLQTQLSSQ